MESVDSSLITFYIQSDSSIHGQITKTTRISLAYFQHPDTSAQLLPNQKTNKRVCTHNP